MVHTLRLDNYYPTPRKLVLGTNSSYGTETIKIERGAGWDGLNLTATWHIPGREEPLRVALLDGDAMDVPPEVTKEAKDGVLVLAGLASGVQRASCNVEYLILEQAGVYGGTDAEPTPELAAQVLEATMQAKANAEAAAQDASEAKANANKAQQAAENAAADAAKAGPYAEAARAAKEAAEADSDDAQAAARAAKASETASAESASNAAADASKAASAAKKAADESVAANIAAIENMQADVASKQTAVAASEKAAAASAASAKTSKDSAAKSAADADSTANSIKDSMAQISENKEAVSQLKADVNNLSKVGHWETVLEGTVETAVITPIEYNEETGEYTCDAADLIGMDVGDSFPVITVPTKEMDAKYYPMGNNLTLTITSTTSYTLSCSIKSFCQSDFTAFPYKLHKSVSVPYVSVKSKRARVTVYGPFFVPMNYYEGGVPPVGPGGNSGPPTYSDSQCNNTASFESTSFPNGHSVYEVESYISKPFTRVSKICNRLYFASSKNTLHCKSIADNYISCVDSQSRTYQSVTTKDGLNLNVMNMGNKTIRMGNGAMYKIERWIE